MSPIAEVRDVETIRRFAESAAAFVDGARDALSSVELDARRTLDWLAHEQPGFWRRQLRLRQEAHGEAKVALARKKLENAAGGHRDLSEYVEAVRIAQRRVLEAEEKLEAIRRHLTLVQKAFDEYQGQARPFAALIEGNPPAAVLAMRRILDALEAYVALTAPSTAAASEPIRTGDVTRPAGETDPPPDAPASEGDPNHVP